jgi:hypothetical protein
LLEVGNGWKVNDLVVCVITVSQTGMALYTYVDLYFLFLTILFDYVA